jgi:hypothetical protein
MGFTPRPHLLSAPNIPKPLHGLNPRTIMGKQAWDVERQNVYASTDYHCAACGVHKSQAKLHKWLEAHEIFEIDYSAGTATLVEIVPLCHFCHSFIHSGLLRVRARKKEVTAQHVRNVLEHGLSVLRQCDAGIFLGTAELCDLVSVDRSQVPVMKQPKSMASWPRWKMIWGENEYRGKYRSMRDWQRAYS